MIKCYKCHEKTEELFTNDEWKLVCRKCLEKEIYKDRQKQMKKVKKMKRDDKKVNETFNERLVDLALNIHHFNQDVMELNIKYIEEIERLNNIIKEVREYIENNLYGDYGYECKQSKKELLEILNKGDD